MEIDFVDSKVALIETERAAETMLPVSVIQSARHRLSIIRAAPDLRTMSHWKSLGLRAIEGSDREYAVDLSAQWAMILGLEEKNNAMTVVIKTVKEQVRGAA